MATRGGAAIGVVAHVDRADQARTLAASVGAVHLSIDDGTLGCRHHHTKVWAHLAQHSHGDDWLAVLEDDAVPVDGFCDQLHQVLSVAPAPVVSLYLGTCRPPHQQACISEAINQADRDGAHWITTDRLLYGVGVAIKTNLVASMLADTDPKIPIDYAIRDWARRSGHRIGFCWPSILDHRDDNTLFRHPDGEPRDTTRKAWRTGTRTHWTNKAVNIA